MFIDADEAIIIMDMNERNIEVALTLNEMKMLKSAGIKTVYLQGLIRWDKLQPEKTVPIDWSVPDGFVDRARAAGLKMLIPCLFSIPQWKPDDFFYSRQNNGQLYDVPDYSSDEVGEELDDFNLQLIARYGGADAQVVYSIPGNGEFALNGTGQMDYPMEMFTDWVVDRQRVLTNQFNEIWTAYHPVVQPAYWKPVYGALYSAFPYAKHYGIIFTYVQHEVPHFQEMLNFNRDAGMVYYGGSEYVQGIRPNLERMKAEKTRMLTCPKHPYQMNEEISDWMLDDIRWALEEYNEV